VLPENNHENIRNKIRGIYIIIDPQATKERDIFRIAQSALEGGVKIVQYRDKINDRSLFLANALKFKNMCDVYDAIFVINDAVDIAKLSEADFLHVGQTDLQVDHCREILTNNQCVGRSNGSVSEALQSESMGCDYIAIGAIYATPTMGKSHRKPLGPKIVSEIKTLTSIPVVAIGGINETNMINLRNAGADSVCIVSAITFSDNPEDSAKKIVDRWNDFK